MPQKTESKGKSKKASLREKIRNLLTKLETMLPYGIVGGGMLTVQYPETLKAVEALLLAYILTKGALQSLKEKNPKAAEVAEKIAKDTEKALEKMGVTSEQIKSLESQVKA